MVSDLNKNFGGSTDLAQKWHGSAELHTPIHPHLSFKVFSIFTHVKKPVRDTQVHCEPALPLRNLSVVYHKTKNPFAVKICMNSSFELLLYIMKEGSSSGGSIISVTS